MRFALKPKKMVQLSLGGAGIVALISVLDLASGMFFGRLILMDVMFLLSAIIVIYLSLTTYREIT